MPAQVGLFDGPAPTVTAPPRRDPANPYGLRWYQRAAKAAIEQSLTDHRSALAVLATGTGKTRLAAAVIADHNGRALWLTHRDELVHQSAEALGAVTGERIGIEQAADSAYDERIVVASVQTLLSAGRLQRLARKGDFTLIVQDEAHHGVSKSFRGPADAFPAAKLLGVTATPMRGDKRALATLYEHVAYQLGLAEAIQAGVLVPIQGRNVHIASIDLTTVGIVAGDLRRSDLDAIMQRNVEAIAATTLREFRAKQGIVFCPSKRAAVYAAERLNAIEDGCAAAVVEDTPAAERQDLMRRLRAGKIPWLCNAMIATEGFDWPAAEVMIGARPTKSRGLYTQMIGRVTRPLPGLIDGPDMDGPDKAAERRAAIAASSKPFAYIADLVGNRGKHDLAGPVDVLGGNFSEAARKRASISLTKYGGDVAGHLERAAAEIARQADRTRLAQAAKEVQAMVQYTIEHYDPFELIGAIQEAAAPALNVAETTPRRASPPASIRQVNYLSALGYDVEKMPKTTSKMASRLIGLALERKRQGLAGPAQLQKLAGFGISNTATWAAAASAIRYLESVGYGALGTVDPARVRMLLAGERPTSGSQDEATCA
jgi:superfamily II DNA or RNA helicase